MSRVVDVPVQSRTRAGWGHGDGERMRYYRTAMVEQDGTVRVWDEVAGHYSLHHDLTEREEAEARRLAAEAR